MQSAHNTTGTIGHDIGAAGAAADPLLNTVPGSYASGTAGYALGRIGSGQIITTAQVAQDGSFTVTVGASYYAADGLAIDFTDAAGTWPNLTGGTVQLRSSGGIGPFAMSIVTAGGSSQKVRLELSATQTAALLAGRRDFDVLATLASGHPAQIVRGQWVVYLI